MLDKKYLKRVGIYIFATVLAIGLALYIGYHLWMNVNREIETIPAVPDTFSITAEYDAWVFRDETVVRSPAGGTGTVVPSVRNGEKVGKTDAVASVYGSVPSEKLSELSIIRSQIRLLEGKHTSAVGGDLGIGEIMFDLSSATKNGSLSSVTDITSRLAALAAARATGGGDTEAVISSLQTKEQELLSSFGNALSTVYTPVSGWFYDSADGYESAFNTNSVEGISPEGLEALLNSSPEDVSDAVGRIVRTYRWYIAVIMSTSDSAAFTEGGYTDVKAGGLSEPITFKVESVVNGSDKRSAVVFSCGTIPDGFDISRHMTLEFTLREIEGFGIPKTAVRMQDDVTGVYTYNGVMVKFRKINILEEYDDMYIAEIKNETEETNAAVTGTDETASPDPLGEGTGRKEYFWLSANEFIVVKGRALKNGRVIG